jgi:hypothetical protein
MESFVLKDLSCVSLLVCFVRIVRELGVLVTSFRTDFCSGIEIGLKVRIHLVSDSIDSFNS